jgi:preprotein translocase subunit SecG
MYTLVIILHVVVSLALILIVLLQTGKGAEMGAGFGGGSNQTIFGSRGAATFLSKVTTGAAVIFMLTSLSLAYLTSQRTGSVIRETAAPAAAPSAPASPTPEAPAAK